MRVSTSLDWGRRGNEDEPVPAFDTSFQGRTPGVNGLCVGEARADTGARRYQMSSAWA
jgi:hypothetical protein